MTFNDQDSSRRARRGALRRLGCVGGLALAWALTPPAYAQTQTISFDIASQPLSSALLTYGRQAGLSVLAPSTLVEGKTAPDVRGQFTAADALDRLLTGSGLQYEFVSASAVRVVGRTQAALLAPGAQGGDGQSPDRVVIVGTTIRGVSPESAPVDIYSAADIAKSGATTTEQFVARLPQNLGTNSPYSSGTTVASPNLNAVSSLDLRGLGVGTTLTLLNGRRTALSDGGRAADVSLIPLAAIDRVEVLTDGASAIYGSDAIGGVVNFVLRKDFDGAETRLAYGGVTSGGLRQGDLSQSFGRSWSGGSGFVSYAYHSASALDQVERSFSAPAGRGSLTPEDNRHNLFATITQRLGDQLTVDADAGFGRRKVKSNFTIPYPGLPLYSSFNRYGSTTENAFGAVGLDYDVSASLSASVDVSYSVIDVDGERTGVFFNLPSQPGYTLDYGTKDTSFDIVAKLEGVALTLPGGEVRFSLGGGQLEQTFKGASPFYDVLTAGRIGRRSPYAFGELFIPVISKAQNIPLVDRLEVSLAARYTDYQDTSEPSLGRDFGNSTDPKIGLLWSPIDDLILRATYGTSFRAPPLAQLDLTSAGHYLVDQPINGAPGTIFALVGQPVPDLGPETAKTYSAGFDFKNEALPGFQLSATYYSIDYEDRIAIAPSGGLNPFDNAASVPDLVYRPPSAAFIEEQLRASPLVAGLNTTGIDLSDPRAASLALFARSDLWIYDVRFRNLALSKQDGFDVSVQQAFDTDWGNVALSANLTRILSYRQRSSPRAPVLSAVEIPGQSPHWRGRLAAGLTRDGFSGTLGLNYADDYRNPWDGAYPHVDSWTTADFNLSYTLGEQEDGPGGTSLTLTVQNLFDEPPPFLGTGSNQVILAPLGFDPANANPLGRVVVLGLTHRW